jgi:predicted AAA+ superfamily ATPase
MSYIYRELQENFHQKKHPFGLILTGIVGCGKTTLIEKIIEEKKDEFKIFDFTGDDIRFRREVAENSGFILQTVQSQTTKPALVFIDEVQKSEEVFDAIKIAFDSKKISFIISGSNPAYLSTIAKKRLQRRAEQVFMTPLSLKEILLHHDLVSEKHFKLIHFILNDVKSLEEVPDTHLQISEQMKKIFEDFWKFGGLPLAYLAHTEQEKMNHIRLTVERGFDLMSNDNATVSEQIKVELARLHSREFSYQNILSLTRLRRREPVNLVIDDLVNHGYLARKRPLFLSKNKSSYLSVFSYIDPGLVSYLQGEYPTEDEKGFRLEGYLHSRLDSFRQNSYFKMDLGYYKFHTLDSADKIKYHPGEIDFIFHKGQRIIPIEAKLTSNYAKIDTSNLKLFCKNRKTPFALVLYGGVPFKDLKNQILYWPYWLV